MGLERAGWRDLVAWHISCFHNLSSHQTPTRGPAGARACLTTPSATKLYATSGAPAQQRLDITLHADAVLEYLPEQMIPFAQAVFHQQITVRLGAGACVLLMEIVAPGRVARGEAF